MAAPQVPLCACTMNSSPHPLATSQYLAVKTGLTPITVNKGLAHLTSLSIVRELTGHKRNRVFSYSAYIAILNEGTELQ